MAVTAGLYTTFTPAPWCSETAINFVCSELAGGDAICSAQLYPVTSETTSCSIVYPTGCNPTPGLYQSYSPAFYCPYGWTPALTISHGPGGSLVAGPAPSPTYYTPVVNETAVYCCPS
jgi:hypothetical protein